MYQKSSVKMAYNKSNKFTLKKPDQNNCTTGIKFKPMLVKDLYKSFETHSKSITDKTQNVKENVSKVAFTSYKNTYYYKPSNNEGNAKNDRNLQLDSLPKPLFKNSVLARDNKRLKSNNIVTQVSQKAVSSNIGECAVKVMRDNFTMTSPNLNECSKSLLKLNYTNSPSERQNRVNKVPCNCENKIQFSNHSASTADSNSSNVLGIENVINQLKTFVEESIQTHQDQISKLKQILSSVNDISNAIKKSDRIMDSSPSNNNESTELEKTAEQSFPLIKVVSNNDSSQKNNQLPKNSLNTLDKVVNENENEKSPKTPKSLKSSQRMKEATKSNDFQGRRRSLSMPSESDLDLSQGSFTMLEKELNIVHKKLSIKQNALTINSPSTPSFAKQWDTKSKRPLKEYMSLKEKSTFLVTPDINWYQLRLKSRTETDS